MQQAPEGGWRLASCLIHASQYIPLLLYHKGSELTLPFQAVFFICVLQFFGVLL